MTATIAIAIQTIASELRRSPPYHYGIVRADLPPEVQAVQLFHAAGESSPGGMSAGTHAVLLHARDEAHLKQIGWELFLNNVKIKMIFEPDAPYHGQLMAIACEPGERSKVKKLLHDLPKMKFGR